MITSDPASAAESAGALAAARRSRGWSQAAAARELAALARQRGLATATPASLKAQLSRWENGHVLPDGTYRSLLVELYGRAAAELGFVAAAPPARPGDRLRVDLAFAEAVDDEVLGLWADQLRATVQVDHRLGAAGAAAATRALTATLHRAVTHLVRHHHRPALLRLIAAAELLAGRQELDADDPAAAWRRHTVALAAGREAGASALVAEAVAAQVALLVEVGEPEPARLLLAESGLAGAAALAGSPGADAVRLPDEPISGARLPITARLAAAVGLAAAALGDRAACGAAFARARATFSGGGAVPDVVVSPVAVELPVEHAEIHASHGRALLRLDAPAVARLEQALAAGPSAARTRVALHADLATALAREGRTAEAAEHAARAHRLADRIGVVRAARHGQDAS